MPRNSRRLQKARAGSLRLVLVLFGLVGINVYFLGLRGGTSIGALLRTTRVRMPALSTTQDHAPALPLPEDPPQARIVEGSLADGQTIAQALTTRVGKRSAALIEQALAEKLDLASVHAGQGYTLIFDAEDRLFAFEFRVDGSLAHHIDLSGRSPLVTTFAGRSDTRAVEIALPAGPAIWDALKHAGESPSLGERLAELFGSEGDLVGANVPSGERVRVVVEKRVIANRFVRYGRILGAEWVTRAGLRRAFSFGTNAYTERGESMTRTYLVSALRPSRSLMPARRPVRTVSEGRVTIDQPAVGSAVACAVATGTIIALTRSANGGSLTIEVAPDERIIYTRLGRLARGLQLGHSVTQGQALAHVDAGVTVTYEGAAAALHDGRQLPPRSSPIPAIDRPRFGETIAPVLERLRALALRNADALAARGLSAIP